MRTAFLNIPRSSSGLLLGGLLLLVCVVRLPTNDLRAETEQFFGIAAIISVNFLLWRINKWMMAFFMLATVSLIYQGDMSKAGVETYRSILQGMIWYSVVATSTTEDDVRILMHFISIIALMNVAYQVLQYYRQDFIFTPIVGAPDNLAFYNPLYGLMAQRNHMSSLFALCFPAFLRSWWALGIPAIALGLYWTESLGGSVAVSIGLFVFLACWTPRLAAWANTVCPRIAARIGPKWFKRAVWAVSALALLLTCRYLIGLILRGGDIGSRLIAWRNAWPIYKEHWVMGRGLGKWGTVFGDKKIRRKMLALNPAHNDVIQATFDMGIGFPIVLAGYLADIWRKARKAGLAKMAVPLTGIMIILANAQVNFIMHIAPTAMIAVTWLAVFEVRAKGKSWHTAHKQTS